jgi:hypothetical protein
MQPMEVSQTVDAPVELVFDAATDLPNAADRIRGIDAIEMLTEGPVGMGTRWRETRTLMGRTATEELAITAWDPPRGYAVEARSCGTNYRTVFAFDEIAPGTTRMTVSFTATPTTLAARIMVRFFAGMRGMMLKCLAADLADVKTHAESAASAADPDTAPAPGGAR